MTFALAWTDRNDLGKSPNLVVMLKFRAVKGLEIVILSTQAYSVSSK